MRGSGGAIETWLREMGRPEPPADLKHRVMATAQLAPAADWRDRVWFSRAWRLAAVGTFLAFLAVDHWAARPLTFTQADLDPTAVSDLTDLARAGLEIGMPVELVRRLAARVEFVPLTAREPLGPTEQALR